MPQCRDPLVYAADTDLATLGTAELLIVAALRLWVAIQQDPAGDVADWRGAFAAAGIAPGGACGFGGLMRILAAPARRPFDVRQLYCRRLGRDEGRLLHRVSLVQRGRSEAATALLALWLPPAAVRHAAVRAGDFAAALADAGLVVPLRRAEAALGRLPACAHAMPGLALVH
jgi:hypothetical protein